MPAVLFHADVHPVRSRIIHPLGLLAALVSVAGSLLIGIPAAGASTTSLVVDVFEDHDRDGVRDADDTGWSDRIFYVMTTGGDLVQGAVTDADGRAHFDALPTGTYDVVMRSPDWGAVRDEWTVTTTDDGRPEARVDLAGASVVSFGWRPITWSTDPDAPISEHVHDSGVRIRSYNDAVTAQQIGAVLTGGRALGPEAPFVEIRYGLSDVSYAVSGSEGIPGAYANYYAVVHIAHGSWLTAASRTLFHEYGHAWVEYRRRIVQQWPDLDPYLEVRGIDPEDPRLYSTHSWDLGEIIAEDYRQLLGDDAGSAVPQSNPDIPPASEVPGLGEWLLGEYSEGGATLPDDGPPPPDPTEDPSPDPTQAPAAPTHLIEVLDAATAATTEVLVDLTTRAQVDLVIENTRGQHVATLARAVHVDDTGTFTWDHTDDRGRRVKDGTYVARVEASAIDHDLAETQSVAVAVGTSTTDGSGGKGGGPKR